MAEKPVEPPPLKPAYAKKRTPKQRAKRVADSPMDTGTETTRLILDQDRAALDDDKMRQEELRKSVIAARISDDLRLAIQARQGSGIEEIWQDSQDLYDGLDQSGNALVKTRDQVPRKTGATQRAKVVLNICKPKTDIATSRIAEMLVPTDDKPWDFKPTPIPDLDPSKIPEDKTVTLSDGATASAQAVAHKANFDAAAACANAVTWVEDGFAEGDVYTELRKQIRNAGRMGTGVIKGPFPVNRDVKKWEPDDSGKMTLRKMKELAPTSKCIRAEDCFPDPACGDSIHRGGYFVERDFLVGKQLRDLAELPGYDAPAIAMALSEGPAMFAKARSRSQLGGRRNEGSSENDAALYEIFYYYGEVRPEDMLLMGMSREGFQPKSRVQMADDPIGTTNMPDQSGMPASADAEFIGTRDQFDPYDPALADDPGFEQDPSTVGGLTYEEMQLYTLPCIVTMLNGRPIKCDMSPSTDGCFPYDFFTWDPVEGQPWGRGVPWKMAVAQRMLNAGVRALMENAGLSSGPQIAIDRKALTPANGIMEIVGRKLWYFDSDEFINDIQKAMATFDIPSQQKELMGIIEFALKMADTLTNLPILMQGEQQPGASPETLGGLKMFMQNASSPLRSIAKGHDDQVTKPHLKRWYDWLMERGPDNAKGDHTIVAKGSTVLVQREESRAFLVQLVPMLGSPALEDVNPSKLIAELAKSNGFTMSTIEYTADEKAERDKKAQENPPPPPPQVQAAQISAQAASKRADAAASAAVSLAQLRTEQETEDRKLRVEELQVKKEIAMLELSTKSGISLDQIKKDLAIAAMGNAVQRDDMQLKLSPDNPSHTGIAGGVGGKAPDTP